MSSLMPVLFAAAPLDAYVTVEPVVVFCAGTQFAMLNVPSVFTSMFAVEVGAGDVIRLPAESNDRSVLSATTGSVPGFEMLRPSMSGYMLQVLLPVLVKYWSKMCELPWLS